MIESHPPTATQTREGVGDGALHPDDLVLVIRIRTPDVPGPAALYERTRAWWRTRRPQAERVRRVLAVIDGTVVEAYEPHRWEDAPAAEAAGRVGFVGTVARDRDRWVELEVGHLFPRGAANPIRYLPVSALRPDAGSNHVPADGTGLGLGLLLRLNRTWHTDITAEELYEAARGWWVLSTSNAHRVRRVLAIADGVVREVYEPGEWVPCPIPGRENRIGFVGTVAADRTQHLGRDLSHLFRPGSANPVRYLPMRDLDRDATAALAPAPLAPAVGAEPDLLERVRPLHTALSDDLLWAQCRAGQELFHSNTLAWLLHHHPEAMRPVLDLLGGVAYPAVPGVEVWRERRNLDIVIDPVGANPKIVVENKLYSVPYPAQLTKYNSYPLPWSADHGVLGADSTRYVLLSLMTPTFPLPPPWTHVSYHALALRLDAVDTRELGTVAAQFESYRVLVRRLVALAEAVDPAQALDEPFIVTDIVDALPGGGLDGAIAKMRFSQLAQLIQDRFPEARSFEVGGDRNGLITYWRRVDLHRRIGWQFQEGQLRYFVTVEDPALQGPAHRASREALVERNHLALFDYDDVAASLGEGLREKVYLPGQWLGFNPDFVYRHRPVTTGVTAAQLAEALAIMTTRVDRFASHPPAELAARTGHSGPPSLRRLS